MQRQLKTYVVVVDLEARKSPITNENISRNNSRKMCCNRVSNIKILGIYLFWFRDLPLINWFLGYLTDTELKFFQSNVIVSRKEWYIWYIWYGMISDGIGWYCMVWHGMAWHGMALYGMALYGMAWYGMIYGKVQNSKLKILTRR